jgi:hypothetical protein
MSSELTKLLIPAGMALAGTIFGLWLGQWRWSAELRMKKRRAFDARRYTAYDELWTILENAHISIRTGLPSQQDIHNLDRRINSFRLRNAVLLDEEDSSLSNRYFNSIVSVGTKVAESGSRQLAEEWERTNVVPAADTNELQELARAMETAERLRGELIARIRDVMLMTGYAVEGAITPPRDSFSGQDKGSQPTDD